MDKRIEDMINDPYNKCVIAYTENRANNRTCYFINVKNRKGNVEKVFIDENDVAYYNGVIKELDINREDKRKLVSKERKEKRDRKLQLLGNAENLDVIKRLDPAIDHIEEEDFEEEEDIKKIVEVYGEKDISDVIKDIDKGV